MDAISHFSSSLLEAGQEPPVGAHIVTPRRGYTHHGIYVGDGCVVQYAGFKFGLQRGPIEEVVLSQFAQGHPIWIKLEESRLFERHEIVRRARSRVGEDCYRLLTNNCEHFCEWCIHGEHRSYQVEQLSDQVEKLLWRPLRTLRLAIGRVAAALSIGAPISMRSVG
jgi:Lecithin retinol acyltransferase